MSVATVSPNSPLLDEKVENYGARLDSTISQLAQPTIKDQGEWERRKILCCKWSLRTFCCPIAIGLCPITGLGQACAEPSYDSRNDEGYCTLFYCRQKLVEVGEWGEDDRITYTDLRYCPDTCFNLPAEKPEAQTDCLLCTCDQELVPPCCFAKAETIGLVSREAPPHQEMQTSSVTPAVLD